MQPLEASTSARLACCCSGPLLGVHSVKTKAKPLPPPVELARASPSVGGGERASKRSRRKRRRQEAGFEDECEDVRKAATWDEEAESSVRQLLPVKTKRGFVSRSTSGRPAESVSSDMVRDRDEKDTSVKAAVEGASEEEGEWEEEEEEEEEEAEEEMGWSEHTAKSTVELLAARQRKLQEKKALIASTSAKLLENPEENVRLPQ